MRAFLLPPVRVRGAGRWGPAAPDAASARASARAWLAELPPTIVGRLVDVTLTNNRRSWLTLRPVDRQRARLSLQWRLLSEPRVLDTALARWSDGLDLGRALQDAIERLATQPRPRAPGPAPRPSFRCHDLAGLLERERVRLDPSPGLPGDVAIAWSRPRAGRRRRTLRLGRADIGAQRITIHPVLDDARVPEYVIASVVFHECCHLAAPPLTAEEAAARREHRIHHRRFRALERRFPQLEEADAWIRDNITDLLRSASR